MPGRMSAIVEFAPQLIAMRRCTSIHPAPGSLTSRGNAEGFIDQIGAGEGVLLVYLRHTSASLTIQENADPDVQSRPYCGTFIGWRRKTRPGSMMWKGRTTCRRMSRRCSTACRCRCR